MEISTNRVIKNWGFIQSGYEFPEATAYFFKRYKISRQFAFLNPWKLFRNRNHLCLIVSEYFFTDKTMQMKQNNITWTNSTNIWLETIKLLWKINCRLLPTRFTWIREKKQLKWSAIMRHFRLASKQFSFIFWWIH